MHIKLKRSRALISEDGKVIERILFEPYGMVFTVDHLWSPLICVYLLQRIDSGAKRFSLFHNHIMLFLDVIVQVVILGM